MDGIHDLGGMQGFGPVVVEVAEPVFHHDWERRVFGLNFAGLGANVDEFRHAVERMDPVEYLTTSYYEHWFHAIRTLALEKGVITAADLDRWRGRPVPTREGAAAAELLVAAVQRPNPPPGPAGETRFAVGQDVLVRRTAPAGHTRCPRYVRGAPGRIMAVRGRFTLPDASAHGRPGVAEPVYSVAFRAAEVFGGDQAGHDQPGHGHLIHADLWESYLHER